MFDSTGPGKVNKNYRLIEILGAFLCLDIINYFFFPQDMGFRGAQFHPYWLIVLLIPSRYGFVAGVWAGTVSAGHYLFGVFSTLPTRAQLERLFEEGQLFMPLAFLIVGIVLGDIRQRYVREADEKERRLETAEADLDQIKAWLERNETARKILEARIVGETTTVKTLYETARKFETLSLQEVYDGCLQLLAEYLRVEKASLYTIDGGYYVLRATLGWDEGAALEGKIARDQGNMMDQAEAQNRLITVKELMRADGTGETREQDSGVLALVPLRDENGMPAGVVNIESMPFLEFTRPNLQLIELVVDWASKGIHNIRFYESSQEKIIFDEDYGVFNFNHFQPSLVSEFRRAKTFKLPLSAALIKIDRFGFLNAVSRDLVAKALVAHVRKYLSETDMVFKYRFEGTFSVLCPMRSREEVLTQLAELDKLLRGGEGIELAKIHIDFACAEISDQMDDPAQLTAPLLKEVMKRKS